MKIAIFGGGAIGRKFLAENAGKVKLVIDHDQGIGSLNGIRVEHPDHVRWNEYFVVITTEIYCDEIKKFLLGKGLKEYEDFISYTEWEKCGRARNIHITYVSRALEERVLRENSYAKIIRSKQEFYDYLEECKDNAWKYISVMNMYMDQFTDKEAYFKGYCEVCRKTSLFRVDGSWSGADGGINWREHLVCIKCGFNSRERLMLRTVQKIAQEFERPRIYINEQLSGVYHYLCQRYTDAVGSEYVSASCESGQTIDGVLHEDAMRLSFAGDSFDLYLSQDVFEHVADYRKIYTEAYRVIRGKGFLVFTIPFYFDRDEIVRRAKLNGSGEVEYLLSPQYHGNPMAEEGSLVFTDYGWDLLEYIREVGFRDVYCKITFSTQYAYLDPVGSIIFIAEK